MVGLHNVVPAVAWRKLRAMREGADIASAELWLPALGDATPWTGLDSKPDRREEFSFLLLSDRTGVARAGVFERAVEIASMLRPDFAIHLGDLIEGYTDDAEQLDGYWKELDAIIQDLDVPFFRVPGNHDASTPFMREAWLRRFGALHYHFRYGDVLFVMLDTQDPPEPADLPEMQRLLAELRDLQDNDPEALAARFGAAPADPDAPMPTNMSDEQLTWCEDVLAEHADVRWTVLCMHMPVWRDATTYARIRSALGDRHFTMFSGHLHNYRHVVLDGRDHITLGPTGGIVARPDTPGSADHVTWITVTPKGHRMVNIALGGVFGTPGNPIPVALPALP